jgi:hypothetical protein
MIHGTQEIVQSSQNDIISSIFILTDMHEERGWKLRRIFSEFFSHAGSKLLSAREPREVLQQLQKAMAEAVRLSVKIEYDVVIQLCYALRRKSADFTEVCNRYLSRKPETIVELGLEKDALGQLDLVVTEPSAEALKEIVQTHT